ncbi:hypothetical protein Pelo_13654 [Pelomyxa schiedti]|nr:hypothetical protein Pelo_13654 [Pelomyxa schiedti]
MAASLRMQSHKFFSGCYEWSFDFIFFFCIQTSRCHHLLEYPITDHKDYGGVELCCIMASALSYELGPRNMRRSSSRMHVPDNAVLCSPFPKATQDTRIMKSAPTLDNHITRNHPNYTISKNYMTNYVALITGLELRKQSNPSLPVDLESFTGPTDSIVLKPSAIR